jgi:hypothetical protein
MSDASRSESKTSDVASPRSREAILYRNRAINVEQLEIFVSVLLRELFTADDSNYYDAIHVAYLESRINPLIPFTCQPVHFDHLIEHVNRFADELRRRFDVAIEELFNFN